MKFLSAFTTITLCVISSFSQELPIQNGELEQTSDNGFTFWTNHSIGGSNAIFDVVDHSELFGSTKALRTQVNALGENEYSVQSKSDHQFSLDANQKVTISFFAKAVSDQTGSQLKLCLSDPSVGSSVFKQTSFELTQNWEQGNVLELRTCFSCQLLVGHPHHFSHIFHTRSSCSLNNLF